MQMTPVVTRALEALGAAGRSGDRARCAGPPDLHPILADELPPMTRLTVTPTGLATYEPANVIPPYADVICDCRALPGQYGGRHLAPTSRRRSATRSEYEIELLEPLAGGTDSPVDTPLYRVCADYVASLFPGAGLLPLVTPGFAGLALGP